MVVLESPPEFLKLRCVVIDFATDEGQSVRFPSSWFCVDALTRPSVARLDKNWPISVSPISIGCRLFEKR
jgi:hypothetical protein